MTNKEKRKLLARRENFITKEEAKKREHPGKWLNLDFPNKKSKLKNKYTRKDKYKNYE